MSDDGKADDGRVAILGAGQMGLVCSMILESRGRDCVLWGRRADHMTELAQTGESKRHLPGLRLPPRIAVTSDDDTVFGGVTLIVATTPTQHIRSVFERLRPHIPPRTPVVSFAKGIENETLLRPTQVIADALKDDPDGPPRPLAALSGPTIAAELARCLPATMIAASEAPALCERLQAAFSTNWLRIYRHSDLLGVELAGATKNVIALAAGMLDGLQAGYNAKSALLARGLAEITRLGVTMGASPDTFFGIAGVGDLATTCFCPEGRNRSCGEELGKGRTLDDILRTTDSVVEGVPTTRSVMALAERYKVEMPITAAVSRILFDGMDPIDAIAMLMARQPKEEQVG